MADNRLESSPELFTLEQSAKLVSERFKKDIKSEEILIVGLNLFIIIYPNIQSVYYFPQKFVDALITYEPDIYKQAKLIANLNNLEKQWVRIRRDDLINFELSPLGSTSPLIPEYSNEYIAGFWKAFEATYWNSEKPSSNHLTIQEQMLFTLNCKRLCIPVPIFGKGFINEMRKITRLTKFLELETWTPVEAAMLVCGIEPLEEEGYEIPKDGRFMLWGEAFKANTNPFHLARRILKVWNARENSPTKVRLTDFVAWCKAMGFDTAWLRSIPLPAQEPEQPQPLPAPPMADESNAAQAAPNPKASDEPGGHAKKHLERPLVPSALEGRPTERQSYLTEVWKSFNCQKKTTRYGTN